MALRKTRTKQKQTEQIQSLTLNTVFSAADIAIGQKALDVTVWDMEGQTDIANYFLIASGTSDRHVKGIADKIEEGLRQKFDEKPISISGYESGEWILLDYGDIVMHIFYEPTRQFYNLDDLWKEATRIQLPEETELHAKKLRTGMYK